MLAGADVAVARLLAELEECPHGEGRTVKLQLLLARLPPELERYRDLLLVLLAEDAIAQA